MFKREKLIRLGFSFLFSIVIFRLVQVMLVDHQRYNVLAQRQHVVQKELTARRGEIYTSDGYPLVLNQDQYLLFAVPAEMDDKNAILDKIIELIGQLLGETPDISTNLESLQTKDVKEELGLPENLSLPLSLKRVRLLANSNDDKDWKKKIDDKIKLLLTESVQNNDNQFVQLLMGLDFYQKSMIEQQNLSGMYFQRSSQRVYPEGEMASHLLGFVGNDEESGERGYFGLEGYYDRDLSGRVGYELLERDVIGQKIPLGLSKIREPSDGRDLILTIQRELQHLLEVYIEDGVDRYDAVSGSAILMNPNSGAVLAMSSFPTYAPEYWTLYLKNQSDVSKIDAYQNLSISSNYEPGSIMKPFTIAAALNEKVVDSKTTYIDTGPVVYSGYKVRTWDDKYHGEIDLARILQLSNNTGAAWVGHQLGFDRFNQYLEKFNLGKATGIDLEGEESGIVREMSEWRDINLANMAFGQGISLTPIQIATVFSALINGGTLYEPFVVQHILDQRNSEPIVISRQPKSLADSVISVEVSELVKQMLRLVVEKGEFRWFVQQAGMDRYSIGGKTGTAQIPVNGTYDPHKTNTTFVGFAPVDKPEFVLVVRLNQPSTSTFSAETAVPLWMAISKELMMHFEIPPNGF